MPVSFGHFKVFFDKLHYFIFKTVYCVFNYWIEAHSHSQNNIASVLVLIKIVKSFSHPVLDIHVRDFFRRIISRIVIYINSDFFLPFMNISAEECQKDIFLV